MAAAYGSLVLTLFAGSTAMLVYLLWRLLSRFPIVPREPRRDAPWGLLDILLALALYVLLSIAGVTLFPVERAAEFAVAVAQPTAEPRTQLSLNGWRTMITIDSGAKLIAVIFMTAFLAWRVRATATDLGWTLAHFHYDVQLGCLTFLAIYMPMMGLQILLVYGLEWKYEHHLIMSVTETKDQLLFALAAIAAAVVAPLAEEFYFRGLLQGWLEKIISGRATEKQVVIGGQSEDVIELTGQPVDPLPTEPKPPLDDNPYASPLPAPVTIALSSEDLLAPPTRRDWVSILLSSAAFSLLHYSHGPAWIPLLIFGAATGFVYQRTHRLWPGIIAHLLLNGTSMLGLWVQVFGK